MKPPLRLTRAGAAEIAKRLPDDLELDRLYHESGRAAEALQRALKAAPEGVVIADLPEWAEFRKRARAFSDAAAARVGL